jgi:hypothetical protein
MARDQDLGKGDHVSRSSHGRRVEGTVEEKITQRTEAAARTVDASQDDPQYKVSSGDSLDDRARSRRW